MRIEANQGLSSAASIQGSGAARKTPTQPNQVDLAKANTLDAALKATPDVRAEQVARAKKLIQSPDYPSANLVDQVAGVLAKNISSHE